MDKTRTVYIFILFFVKRAIGFEISNHSSELFQNCNFYFIPTFDVTSKENFVKMPKFFDKFILSKLYNFVPRIINTFHHSNSNIIPNKHWKVHKTSKLNEQDSRTRIVFVDIKNDEVIDEEPGYKLLIDLASHVLNPAYIFAHAKDPTKTNYYNGHALITSRFKLVLWSLLEKYKDLLFIPCIACNSLGLEINIGDVTSLRGLDGIWWEHNRNMQNRIVIHQADDVYEHRKGIYFE
jgi:hypothetical protein